MKKVDRRREGERERQRKKRNEKQKTAFGRKQKNGKFKFSKNMRKTKKFSFPSPVFSHAAFLWTTVGPNSSYSALLTCCCCWNTTRARIAPPAQAAEDIMFCGT